MNKNQKRYQQTYDHRLRELVRATQDPAIVAEFGVPRSTALGWLRGEYQPVVTDALFDMDIIQLQAEIVKLRRTILILSAIIRLMRILLHVVDIRLDQQRLPEGSAKAELLRAIEKAQAILTLKGALRVIGLSPARYHQWRNNEQRCDLDDHDSCPRSMPSRLTADEVLTIKSMLESPDYRHVPTGRLALLAQRLGKVFAAPATWYRLVREHCWRRPQTRIHPAIPKTGLRATKANEYWHIDTTLIRLLDGSKVYLHAVIDNFSRKILAWCVAEKFQIESTLIILKDAVNVATANDQIPSVVTDAGVENLNHSVDSLIELGLFRRVVALKEVTFSNSLIEAWWRVLKHQWLYLKTLDSVEAVRKLVSFYVSEYNSTIPHSAFQGQTPDEVYACTGMEIPAQLEQAKQDARQARRQANRALSCGRCQTRDSKEPAGQSLVFV